MAGRSSSNSETQIVTETDALLEFNRIEALERSGEAKRAQRLREESLDMAKRWDCRQYSQP